MNHPLGSAVQIKGFTVNMDHHRQVERCWDLRSQLPEPVRHAYQAYAFVRRSFDDARENYLRRRVVVNQVHDEIMYSVDESGIQAMDTFKNWGMTFAEMVERVYTLLDEHHHAVICATLDPQPPKTYL